MGIKELKDNVIQEKVLVSKIKELQRKKNNAHKHEIGKIDKAIISLMINLRNLNDMVPRLLREVSNYANLDGKSNQVLSGKTSKVKNFVDNLDKKTKEKFLKDLKISKMNIRKVEKNEVKHSEHKLNPIIILSTKVFGNVAESIKGSFSELKKDLKEANIVLLLQTYLALAMFSSVFVFLITLIPIAVIGLFINTILFSLWVPFALFFIVLIGFYLYPAVEKGNVKGKISGELPFATIYMSAIASSNMEPTRIFTLLSESPEYPNVAREIKKVLNQVELYGYDLVSALKNVAKSTPNEALKELLGGMAINIVSGGSLKNYFEKKANSLLNDYKLERQKYNSVAGTFMDVYISILITAPLILVLIFVVMAVTDMDIGIPTTDLLVLTVSIVFFFNIIFLIFLQIKQPKT